MDLLGQGAYFATKVEVDAAIAGQKLPRGYLNGSTRVLAAWHNPKQMVSERWQGSDKGMITHVLRQWAQACGQEGGQD